MYYKRNVDGKSGFLLVLVEVDVLVITGDKQLVNNLRQNLLKEYSITQFEPINSFLGINIKYDIKAGQLTMDIAKKIDALFLEKPRLQNIGSNNIPMVGEVNGDFATVGASGRSRGRFSATLGGRLPG